MKTIEVYKGFSILEAFGEHKEAGYKVQIDMSPTPWGKGWFWGEESVEKARKEIDWMREAFDNYSFK